MSDVPKVPKFTRRQRLFIEWLATSKYERKPPTQEMLAVELGVCRKTLTRWKKKPGLVDETIKVARKYIHDRLPEVYAALAREAEKGSYQHIKLMLEVTGEYQEKKAVDVTTKGESLNESRVSDSQRLRAITSLYDALKTEAGNQDNRKQAVGSGESSAMVSSPE